MMQSTASGAELSREALFQELHQVFEQLSQNLPNPKNCPTGADQSLTCQQFLQLMRTW